MYSKILEKFNRKPWPYRWVELKNLKISYSQFGEDIILSNIFGHERSYGSYIDVGCSHPLNYSNSYKFYRKGWSGICIDANNNYRPLWKKYRPNDIFINSAITSINGTIKFTLNKNYPECSRVSNELDILKNTETIEVKSQTLNHILINQNTLEKVDFLNIDCEGSDFEVLKTFDIDVWKPKVIAIEDDNSKKKSQIFEYLSDYNYKEFAACAITRIMVLENHDLL